MESHEVKVSFSSDVGISPEEFVQLWNASPELASLATADTERARGIFGVESVNEIVVVLGNIAVGVASSAIYDMIQRAFARHKIFVNLHEVKKEGETPHISIEREATHH